jgi:hypothetical protein
MALTDCDDYVSANPDTAYHNKTTLLMLPYRSAAKLPPPT